MRQMGSSWERGRDTIILRNRRNLCSFSPNVNIKGKNSYTASCPQDKFSSFRPRPPMLYLK
jgi:hypothetical protein